MATRFLDKVTTPTTTDTPNLPNAAGIAYDTTTGTLVYNDAGTLRYITAGNTAPVTASGTTLTASPSLHAGRTVLLTNVAGCAVTLPAATGSGAKYRFVRGAALTSGSDVISAAASELFAGFSITEDSGDTTPADATIFATVNASTNTWTNAFSAGGGEIGDFFECEDIATDRWSVKGWIQAVLDSTATPFSAV